MGEKTVQDLIAEGVEAKMAEVEKKYEGLFNKQAPAAVVKEPEVDGSITAARYVKLLALHNGDVEKVAKTAERMYPRDAYLNDTVKALSATNPSDGGFLVPEAFANELITPLYNSLAIMQAGARRIPMPNGNLSIPRMDTGASVGYIGENSNAGKTQQVFGDVKLSAKKLAALIPVSNDLLRSTSIAADMFIRDDLVRQMQIKMDYTALYGIGSAHSPSGLSGLLPSDQIVGSSSTAFTSSIPADLIGKLLGANVPMNNAKWIINGQTFAYLINLATTTGHFLFRDEMLEAKTLTGVPYIISNQVAWTDDTVDYVDIFLGDFSDFIIGEQLGLEITSSNTASYYDGSSDQSSFQKDQTVIRALSTHDFAVRHTASFIKGTYKLASS
jgi:HK97 family phage major capsid protein